MFVLDAPGPCPGIHLTGVLQTGVFGIVGKCHIESSPLSSRSLFCEPAGHISEFGNARGKQPFERVFAIGFSTKTSHFGPDSGPNISFRGGDSQREGNQQKDRKPWKISAGRLPSRERLAATNITDSTGNSNSCNSINSSNSNHTDHEAYNDIYIYIYIHTYLTALASRTPLPASRSKLGSSQMGV